MSREIKFRVWSSSDKQYRTDCYTHELFTSVTGTTAMIYNEEGDEFIIEQYTSLKDKNGKEIYEGDIVVYYDNTPSQIVWDRGAWVIETISEPDLNAPLYGRNTFCEVIGNVHENPELLDYRSQERRGER